MKKSILFGALAFFAISALGIQNATAQNVDTQDKKAESKAVAVEKKTAPSAITIKQEPVKEKKADCCAKKNEEAKKAGCCANKKEEVKKADCCAEKKAAKDESKAIKTNSKSRIEKEPMKPSTKKEVKKAEKNMKVDK